jgi:hypothetical protein
MGGLERVYADVCFTPKATKLLCGNGMTLSARKRHMQCSTNPRCYSITSARC